MGSGTFIVDSDLYIGDVKTSKDSIRCQSIISKNLGDFNTWDGKLNAAIQIGYNTLHFTPFQVRQ